MPTTHSVPTIRLTMSDNNTRPLSPPSLPPIVTLTLDPESVSPTSLPKTKRNLLSTLKNSPSMLRKKIKPPLLRDSHRTSWEGTDGSAPPPPTSPSQFTGKEFHVKYQGRVRVTTLQVSEAVSAVKKLAPELTASQSVSSSTEDLDVPPSLSPGSPSTLPRTTSPILVNPKSPKPAKSPKSFHKSCNLTITKHSVCIVDDERLVNETIPIATIAYCATDLRYPRAVAMICKTHKSNLLCHVFICSSREKAEKIVAVIGKAFESAWQDWKLTHEHSPNGTVGVNNNYETFVRGRSRSYDNILKPGQASGLGESARERHSSYEIRNGDLSSSPEDD